VQVGPEKVYKFYRRLLPGQAVDGDQVIAMIECSKAITALQQKQTKIDAAIHDEKSAKYAADEAEARYERDVKSGVGASPADKSLSLATANKAREDYKVKSVAIVAAKKEFLEAENYYNLHHIR